MIMQKKALWKFLGFIIIFASAIIACNLGLPVEPYAQNDSTGTSGPKLNREQLQAAVVNYADRFLAIIGQAAFQFEAELPTSEARLMSARRKVYSLSSAVSIAAGPDPAVAMLDLVVLSSLNRMVWQDYWQPKVFGPPAAIIVDAFKRMEDDIYSIAANLLNDQQLKELRDLISDWHAQHPDQLAVDFIRFSDFGELGRKPELKKIKAPGGLLAPVKEAAQAADEIRLSSERAMFLFTKLQLILGLQAELVYKELVVQPEVVDLLNNIDGFRKQLEEMPDHISNERREALQQASHLVSNERQAILKAFDARESKLRKILEDTQATMDRADALLNNLQRTMDSAEKIMEKTGATGKVFNDLVTSVDHLAARMDIGGVEKTSGEPFDINDYLPALEKLNQTVQDATVLVGAVDQQGVHLFRELVSEINTAAAKRVYHVFWLLVVLFAFMGIMGVFIVFLHHRLKKGEDAV